MQNILIIKFINFVFFIPCQPIRYSHCCIHISNGNDMPRYRHSAYHVKNIFGGNRCLSGCHVYMFSTIKVVIWKLAREHIYLSKTLECAGKEPKFVKL